MKTYLSAKANLPLLILLTTSLHVTAQTGKIDSSFGRRGFVLTKIEKQRDDIAQAIGLTSNQKIVVTGNSYNIIGYSDVGIVRYNQNGTADKTFGNNGKLTVKDAFCNKIAIQKDGKIVMAGDVAVGSQLAFKVWRFTANGNIDSSFGTNGTTVLLPPNGYAICYSVALQPDGKIVVGGYDGSFYASLFVFRLTKNGKLDNTFNGTGYNAVTQSRRNLECHKLLIQPDGKIVAAGALDTILYTAFFRYYYLVVRFNINGTLDSSFGRGGIVRESANSNDGAYSAGLLNNGNIVISGYSEISGVTKQSALCLNSNGSVNTSFGINGYQYINYFGSPSFGESVAIQTNGKILLAGNVTNGVYRSIGLARLNPNGSMDATFGNNGRDTFFSVSSASASVGVNEMILQADGKILTTGYLQANKDYFFTARYLNAQQLTSSIAGNSQNISTDVNASIFPNPVVSNQLRLQFNNIYPGKTEIGLYDINGKQITRIIKAEPQGLVEETITIPATCANGTYFLVLQSGSQKKLLNFQLLR